LDSVHDSSDTGDSGDSGDSGTPTPRDDPACLPSGGELDLDPTVELEDRLPVVGEPTGLSVNLRDRGALVDQGYREVGITLCLRPEDGVAVQVDAVADHPLDEKRFESSWVPDTLGGHEAWAVVTVGALASVVTPTRPLFATPRRLHFNFWSYREDQVWVTSVLTPGDEDLDREWKRSGVKVLDWAWGYSHPDAEVLTAEEWAAMWLDMPERFDGFMLDEFSGGEWPIDQTMGEGIQLVEEQQPELFTALYSVGLSGTEMTTAYRVADLGLAETYAGDWRSYSTWDSRYGQYVDAGIEDHAVGVLALYQASHEREIRQQVAYVRSTFPDMPGLAFFSVPQSEAAGLAVDDILWDYYIRPALLLVEEEGSLVLRNLGCLVAEDVEVVYTDEEGDVAHTATVSELAGWQDVALDAVEGAVAAAIAEAPDRYTVISYVDPTELPLPDSAESATARAWVDAAMSAQDVHSPLEGRPELAVEVGEDGATQQATLALPEATEDGAVTLTFELEVITAWFYGQVGVGLSDGENWLGLDLGHGDNDRDLPGDWPRVTLSLQTADGKTVHDTSAPGLEPGVVYTLVASYDPAGEVRGLVFDSTGALIWDTGALAVDGPFSSNTLVLDVRDHENSTLSWDTDPSSERVRMFGTDIDPYAIDAWVGSVEIAGAWTP